MEKKQIESHIMTKAEFITLFRKSYTENLIKWRSDYKDYMSTSGLSALFTVTVPNPDERADTDLAEQLNLAEDLTQKTPDEI
nr:hypothetical protein [Pseudomonadota bacterium]